MVCPRFCPGFVHLIGTLEEVAFIDTASGEVLCRIRPGQGRCTGR